MIAPRDGSAVEPDRPALTDLEVGGFDVLLGLPGARKFDPKNIRRWVFERGASDLDQMTDVPKTLRAEIAARFDVRRTKVVLDRNADDGTRKLLLGLRDGQTIETVIIPEDDRRTLCVSTQVGCGVRCAFCASGMAGFSRNLTPGEIVEQFLHARALLAAEGRTLTNLVVMGGGEPLNNFENLKTALDTLNSPDGLGFGARRITVSTIGIPAKIDRLEELGKQVNLAISLHAPTEELRGRLMPGLDRVPLGDVLAAAERYFERTGREVTFEYVVLRDVNDSVKDARELARLLKRVRGTVNFIPLNPVEGLPFGRPDDAVVDLMVDTLRDAGVKTTVRRNRGRDIDAACGQLRRRFEDGSALR